MDVIGASEIVFGDVANNFVCNNNAIGVLLNYGSMGFIQNPQTTTNNSDVGVSASIGSKLHVARSP
jgi:hypothetical protein